MILRRRLRPDLFGRKRVPDDSFFVGSGFVAVRHLWRAVCCDGRCRHRSVAAVVAHAHVMSPALKATRPDFVVKAESVGFYCVAGLMDGC